MYALTTHTNEVSLKPRSAAIDGNATFTIVVSITIMSTPRHRTISASQRLLPWMDWLTQAPPVGQTGGGGCQTRRCPARSRKTGRQHVDGNALSTTASVSAAVRLARLRAVAAGAKSHSTLSGVDGQLVGYSDLRTPMRKARRLILI